MGTEGRYEETVTAVALVARDTERGVERFWNGMAIDVARSLEMNERSAPLSIKASAGVEKGPRVTETRIFDDEVEVDMARRDRSPSG